FLETVKVDLFTDEVFVFTPKGDVRSLPQGSCPIDFAYAIHSEVGAHCAGAKVNGKMVPLRYKLKNGDSVEILTNANVRPNKDWLSFVKTSRAQTKIRQFIKQQQRERSLEIGRDLLEREFRRFDLTFGKAVKTPEFLKVANDYGHARPDDLVSAVGYGKLSPANVLQRLLPPERRAEKKRAVNLRVRSDDRKGLLAKMSETFADVGVNILQANARSNGDNGAVSTFEIEIVDVKQLNDVVRAIGQIPGVHSVERV